MAIAYRNNDIGTEARSDVYGISDTNIDDWKEVFAAATRCL